MGCLVKYIYIYIYIYIYGKVTRLLQYQQLAVEEHLRTCVDGKFHMFPFCKILKENKSL